MIIMQITLFPVLCIISVVLFAMVLSKQTFIAQMLSPSIAMPDKYNLGEYTGDIDLWLRPYWT